MRYVGRVAEVVASYGVMPQTYIVAFSPGVTGEPDGRLCRTAATAAPDRERTGVRYRTKTACCRA